MVREAIVSLSVQFFLSGAKGDAALVGWMTDGSRAGGIPGFGKVLSKSVCAQG